MAVDQGQLDRRVVALDHPYQAEHFHRRLGDGVQLGGQALGVDDHQVGAVADADIAGVHADEVGQLAAAAAHRLAQLHEGRTGQLRITHVLEEAQREVVLGDGAQVRAGVGEAGVGPGAGQQLAHDRLALVAVAGGPLQRLAVLAGQLEVGVHRVQATGLAQLLEVLADQGRVRALGHPAVGEVAVPQALGEDGLDLLLEQGAELRLQHLGVELVRVLDVAQDLAGAELLEGVHVEPFQAQGEGRRQGLPAEVAAQHLVRQPAGEAGEAVQQRLRLEVQRGEHGALERLSEPAVGLPEEGEHVDLGHRVRRALQHRATAAENGEQARELLPAGEGRGQRAGPGAVAVHLVQARGHHRQADAAGVQRLFQQLFHALQLGFARRDLLGGTLQAHHRHAQLGVAEEGIDVRPQRQLLVEGAVAGGVAPALLLLEDRQHVLARHRLDAGEQVRAVLRLGQHHADRAGADGHAGHAVAHRLLQRRRGDHLGVVVRVDFQKARGHPLAGGVDHLRTAALIQRAEAEHVDAAVADADMADRAGGAAAVEVQAVLDDDVVAHASLQGASSRVPVSSSRQ